ncbi:radical SAM protein [candidate division KSB1 bacterium]
MKINEIFVSIQGESTYSGLPFLFIRAAGCDLRCTYCDTQYAYYDGKEISLDSLVGIAEKSGVDHVEITGGEPLLQNETGKLVSTLLDKGFIVLVETSGSEDISNIDKRAIIIMDVKCPSSGMSDKFLINNINHIKENDEIKFVLSDRDDYNWAVKFINENKLETKANILFSPVFGKLKPADLAKWMTDDKKNYRLNLQLHKYIWDPDKRGV